MAQLLEWKIEENEVLLFRNNEPVLKVERGTTLDVLKLLYEADPQHTGKVIGLRPLTDEQFPCVLTLNQSVLIHSKYEIIVHEQSSCQTSKQRLNTNHDRIEPSSLDSTGSTFQSRCCSPPTSRNSVHSKWNSSDNDGSLMTSNHITDANIGKLQNVPTGGSGGMAIDLASPPRAFISHNNTKPVALEAACNIQKNPTNMSFSSHHSFILPKKNLTMNGPFYSNSRRKRNARKSAFARKITLMTPNQQGDTSSRFQVQTLAFTKPQASLTNSSSTVRVAVSDNRQCLEDSDTLDGCDDTIMSEEEKESPEKNLDEDSSAPVEAVTSAHSSQIPTLNFLYKQNEETEQLSASNQPEENLLEKLQMLKNGHDTPRKVQESCNLDPHTDSEGSCVDETDFTEDHVQNGKKMDQFMGENDAYRTAVVRLQDTVQVKTEPSDDLLEKSNVNSSPENSTYQTLDIRSGPDNRKETTIYKPCSETSVPSSHTSVLTSSSLQGPHTSENSQLPHLQVTNNSVYPENSQMQPVLTSSSLADVSSKSKQSEESAHKCNECLKVFETPGSLDRHKRSHSGERPYVCRVCGWGFTTMGNLNQHMAIHQKVKPFKCVYCGKTFARSNVLKAHVRSHTGERPFQCELCGSKFVIEHNLKKHLLVRHQVEVSSE